MLEPLPFALAATGCPPHAELAVSMASAFHDVDGVVIDGALDELAGSVVAPRCSDPVEGLHAIADLWRTGALPQVEPDTGFATDLDHLMLDTALAVGIAHPLVQVLAAIEAGRRCGIPLGLVSNGITHCVAHTRLERPFVVSAPQGELIDGRTLPPVLTWCCAHEACAFLLDELEERQLRCGMVGHGLKSAELRFHLPIDDRGQERAKHKLASVRARLN